MSCILKSCSPSQQHSDWICIDPALCSTWEGQGRKWDSDNCLVTCCRLSMSDEWENTGCCYSVWSAVVFFRAGSPLPCEGGHVALVCSGTPALSNSGAVACLAVTSLACWLLGCWRGSPMFGNVVVSCLWNCVRMHKNELQLGQTVVSGQHELCLSWVQHLTPSRDEGSYYIIAHVTC